MDHFSSFKNYKIFEGAHLNILRSTLGIPPFICNRFEQEFGFGRNIQLSPHCSVVHENRQARNKGPCNQGRIYNAALWHSATGSGVRWIFERGRQEIKKRSSLRFSPFFCPDLAENQKKRSLKIQPVFLPKIQREPLLNFA